MADSSELLEAEKSLISGCIQDKDIFYKASGSIEPSDFESENLRLIFNDLTELRTQKGGADLASLIDYMGFKKTLDQIKGGKNFILELVTTYHPVLDEISYYVKTIKDNSLARKFFRTVHQIEDDYNNKSITDISEFIGGAETRLIEITNSRSVSDFKAPKEVITSLNTRFQEEYKFRKENNIKESYLIGYPTGYEDLDKMTGGFQTGETVILAARPSVGKTAFALNLAHRSAKANRPVAIFSLEMSAESVMLRILSMESKLTTFQITQLSSGEESYYETQEEVMNRQSLMDAQATLQNEPLFIDDSSSCKVADIVAKTRKLKAKYPTLSLVIIDYLGLITTSNKSSQMNRTNEIGEITRSLHNMARDLNVTCLVLCQLSRSIETRIGHKPQMSDLRDSGNIEQDADKIFTLFRPDYYKDDDQAKKPGQFSKPSEQQVQVNVNPDVSPTTLSLLKNRNGQLGEIKFSFYKKYCRFEAMVDETKLPPDPNMN